ncbi:MAG: ANTAR domain-containing protein [Lachnospiraceae bacterium]|nr:ANTAR domain-containing protein [Lachnospiraceae bacterium]
MISVIVVFSKIEEAKGIRSLLTRNGIHVAASCTSGTQAITFFEDLDEALIVCGYKFTDMLYTDLLENLPDTYEMLVVASGRHYVECDRSKVVCLGMPIRAHELVETVNVLLQGLYEKQRKRKAQPKRLTEEERAVIESAKLRLIEQKKMSEEEAHRYLQKRSMDTGVNMVETAQMILEIF